MTEELEQPHGECQKKNRQPPDVSEIRPFCSGASMLFERSCPNSHLRSFSNSTVGQEIITNDSRRPSIHHANVQLLPHLLLAQPGVHAKAVHGGQAYVQAQSETPDVPRRGEPEVPRLSFSGETEASAVDLQASQSALGPVSRY